MSKGDTVTSWLQGLKLKNTIYRTVDFVDIFKQLSNELSNVNIESNLSKGVYTAKPEDKIIGEIKDDHTKRLIILSDHYNDINNMDAQIIASAASLGDTQKVMSVIQDEKTKRREIADILKKLFWLEVEESLKDLPENDYIALAITEDWQIVSVAMPKTIGSAMPPFMNFCLSDIIDSFSNRG